MYKFVCSTVLGSVTLIPRCAGTSASSPTSGRTSSRSGTRATRGRWPRWPPGSPWTSSPSTRCCCSARGRTTQVTRATCQAGHHVTLVTAAMMARLLEMGADPRCQDGEGRTCLHLAANNDSRAAAEILIKMKVGPRQSRHWTRGSVCVFSTGGGGAAGVTPVCYIALQTYETIIKQKRYFLGHNKQPGFLP